MRYGICHLSVIPLRATPAHHAEMISQILFGESFELISVEREWVYVRLAHDDYEGWIENQQFIEINPGFFLQLQHCPLIIAGCYTSNKVDIPPAGTISLLHGSTLPLFEDGCIHIGGETYPFKGMEHLSEQRDFRRAMVSVGQCYVGAPYLWGGRSRYGIDCAGLTQLLYKHFGIRIPRDAWQQAEKGRVVDFIQEVQPGDLAFFDNEEGRIMHVGVMMDTQHVLHASGRVKIDLIDGEGIFSRESNRYTHKLRIIKRYVE